MIQSPQALESWMGHWDDWLDRLRGVGHETSADSMSAMSRRKNEEVDQGQRCHCQWETVKGQSLGSNPNLRPASTLGRTCLKRSGTGLKFGTNESKRRTETQRRKAGANKCQRTYREEGEGRVGGMKLVIVNQVDMGYQPGSNSGGKGSTPTDRLLIKIR